MASFFNIAPV